MQVVLIDVQALSEDDGLPKKEQWKRRVPEDAFERELL